MSHQECCERTVDHWAQEIDCSESLLFFITDEPKTRAFGSALASSLGVRCELFSSAEEFLARFSPSLAGCLLTDIHLKNMSGLELQDALAARGSTLPIVFVSDSVDVARAVRAMMNGALTVIEKPYRTDDLVEVIRYGLQTNRKVHTVVAKRAEVRRRLQSLTVQERRVLEMIIEGIPNKRITRVFGVSQRTVARLRARVYEKMCVESAFELARVIAESRALPAVDGQEYSLVNGKQLRTQVRGDYAHDVAPENGGQQTIVPPPHFQHDQQPMPSGKSDRKHP
jgi:FixJ family two-component response regulator